jgi:hypothetical protein
VLSGATFITMYDHLQRDLLAIQCCRFLLCLLCLIPQLGLQTAMRAADGMFELVS